LEEAYERALETNPDYQNYKINQQKAEIDFKQTKRNRLPVITGTFSGQRNIDLATTPLPGEIFGQPGEIVETQFGQDYNYNAGITISKSLFDRSERLQIKMSEFDLRAQKVESAIFKELLLESVSLYYYTGLIATQSVQTGQRDLETANQILEITKSKHEQGLVDLSILNLARINVNFVKQSLNGNRQLELQSMTELKKLFGMGPSELLRLTDTVDITLPPAQKASTLRPDLSLEKMELQLSEAETQIKLSKAARLPTLALNSYYGRQQFRDDFGLSFGSDNWSNYSYLGLNLTVPIFTGFKTKSNIKQSQLNQQIAYNEKLKAENHAQFDDLRLIADYNISLENAQSALESYELYDQNQRLAFQKYDKGLISLDAYLNDFEDYIKAENNYLESASRLYSYYSQILPRIPK